MKTCEKNKTMRISWWIGRLKRILPFVVLALLWLWMMNNKHERIDHEYSHKAVNLSIIEKVHYTPVSQNQWIVLITNNTGLHNPCFTLASSFPGYQVLIANITQKVNVSHSRCHYLSVDETNAILQENNLPGSHALVAAYLYAIQHMTEVIYTIPFGIDISKLEPESLPDSQHTHWLSSSNKQPIFSSEKHFGCNTSSQHKAPSIHYSFCQRSAPQVVSPMTLLTKQECDHIAPPVMLEYGTYARIQLSGSLVWYKAFWVLSSCAHDKSVQQDCEIWKIIIQNLLWRTQNTLMVYHTPNTQISNKKGFKVLSVTKFLNSWKCPLTSTMACGINLLEQLLQLSYLSKKFVDYKIKWFKALDSIGYKFPKMFVEEQKLTCLSSEQIFYKPNFYSEPKPKQMKHIKAPIPNRWINLEFHNKTCNGYDSKLKFNLSVPWLQMHDILLIIVFNSPYYNNIPYIEVLYRSIFPSILYCGPQAFDVNQYPWSKQYSFSFVTFTNLPNHTVGAFNYQCVIKAINIGYNVAGYLIIADDLLLLPHSLPEFDKNNVWYIPPDEVRIGEITKLRECRLGMCDFHPHWHWWEDYQNTTINALNAMKNKHGIINKCHHQLLYLNKAELRPNGAYSDIYYIPSRLKEDFKELFTHFLDFRVFVEIAVPSVINCLEGCDNVNPLPGKQLWDESRDTPWIYFSNKNLLGKKYLHPVKWSLTQNSAEMTEFFCSKALPFLYDHFERIEM